MKEKIKMDVNKCLTDLMEQYEYEDIKELFEALNNSIFKKELFAYMSKELDEENLKCPYCGNQHVHKNGKTPQGVQRYKCTCKKTFILRHNTLMYHSHLSSEQWNMMLCSTLNNDSLQKMAGLTGISITSAFYCRHKILYVLVQIMNEDIYSFR